MAANHQDSNGAGESAKRTALDSTLPPTSPKDLPFAGGANIFVLSIDRALVHTVQTAAGERYPVFVVSAWSDLTAAIQSGRCGIALLDGALIGNRLAKRLAELERYSSRLVTLVAADRNDAQELIGYISDRKIHRLLIKPPALGITRLLLESATSRCIQLRELASRPEPILSDVRPRVHGSAGAARRPTWILATALVSIVIGVLVVAALTRSMWQPAPAVAESRAADAIDAAEALPTENVEPIPIATQTAEASTQGITQPPDPSGDLLARAQLAFREGRLARPAGDNALDYYLTALAAEPTHTEARDGLANVVDALFTQAEAALVADSLDGAAATLASIRRADPTSARLAFLDTQLQRARTRLAEARTAEQAAVTVALPTIPSPAVTQPAQTPAADDQPPSELESLLTIAASRIQRGQLLQPARDSALTYIERAAGIDPNDQRVLAARADLASAVIAAARVVLNSADLQLAVQLLEEARALGADRESVAGLALEIAAARDQALRQRHAELFNAARERVRRGELVEPDQDSALHYFLTLKAENPEYPDLSTLTREFSSALAADVRVALDLSDWSSAESWLGSLARVAPNSADGAVLAEQLQTLRLQEQYLASVAPASELRLVSFAPPTYPADAVRAQVEGWVDLEFIVGRDGRPRELVATHAEPADRFEQAAIVAVSQYRYAPFELDGKIFERRVRLRVRFTLE